MPEGGRDKLFYLFLNPYLMREIIQTPLIVWSLGIIIAGIFWSFVYYQKLNSAVGGISHASLAGIGLGYLVFSLPIYWAYLLAPFLGVLLGYIAQRHKQNHDALISLIWAGGMSLGILLLYLSPWYTAGLQSYLFGNILFTSGNDILILSVLTGISLIFFTIFKKVLIIISYDPEFARVQKLPYQLVYYTFMILIAFVIVALTKIIWIVLILAIFSLPTLTSINFKKSLTGIMSSNITIGLLGIWWGIIISYYLNIPSSPIIVGILIVLYGVSLIIKK